MTNVQRPFGSRGSASRSTPPRRAGASCAAMSNSFGPSFGCPLCAMPSCSIVRHQLSYRYECRNRMACGWSQRIPLRDVHPLLVGARRHDRRAALPAPHGGGEQDGPAQISSRLARSRCARDQR